MNEAAGKDEQIGYVKTIYFKTLWKRAKELQNACINFENNKVKLCPPYI